MSGIQRIQQRRQLQRNDTDILHQRPFAIYLRASMRWTNLSSSFRMCEKCESKISGFNCIPKQVILNQASLFGADGKVKGLFYNPEKVSPSQNKYCRIKIYGYLDGGLRGNLPLWK